ncbi:MAG: DUF72 domain-containing protein [Caldilineaceae bacterium]|nr:DUF72 domain-containing protein [Caldilineaceae bacterium]
MNAVVHLGTSSWLFEGWRGVFYPEKVSRTQYLSHYATHFDTVEVNTSFYAIPAPSTLLGWVESVPAGFSFALKFPRIISHEKRLVDCTAETLQFIDALHSLGDLAGPAFLQLPPDFTRQVNGRALAYYLDWLAPRVANFRIAVEVRAQDLMTAAFAGFVAEHNFALVLVDRAGTPDLFETWFSVVKEGAGPDFCFVRWIGDDRNGPQGDRELQTLRDEQLDQWADRIVALCGQGKSFFGYMHNPYEGHSPASVRRLMARLEGRVKLPAWPPPSPNEVQLSLL